MGLFKSDPTPPPAPDPIAVANAQAASNKATAISQYGLNATNQITPYGALSYRQIGTWADGTPRFEATQSLSPEQQQLYNQYTQNQLGLGRLGGDQIGRIAGLLGTPFDINSAAGTQQADIQRKLLDPTWNARAEQLQTQLLNQGIQPGTAAYDTAMKNFNLQRDDAYNSALLASRGQAVQEALSQRNQPLNEISALLSGSQVQQPNFVGTPQTQVAPTNVLGAYQLSQDAAQNVYNQQMAQQSALYGALGSLGGTALGGWASGGFAPFGGKKVA